jgi:hypothetical protein
MLPLSTKKKDINKLSWQDWNMEVGPVEIGLLKDLIYKESMLSLLKVSKEFTEATLSEWVNIIILILLS